MEYGDSTISEESETSVEDLNFFDKAVRTLMVVTGVIVVFQPLLFIFPDILQFTIFFWAVTVGFYWLLDVSDQNPWTIRWGVSVVFSALTVIASVYVFVFFRELSVNRLGLYNDLDIFVGFIILASTLIATYYEYGPILTSVGIFALIYGLFGPLFPGILSHGGLAMRTVTANTVEFSGVFGFVSQAAARWVFIFLIFAGLIKAYGALNIFIQMGAHATRVVSSGIAQMSVISSSIIGTISGSPLSNVALTGSLTIPLMIDFEISPSKAGAIECVASNSGQIAPPVMGVVAFVMADLLGMPYGELIIMAFFPALIFYLTVFISVHVVVKKEGKLYKIKKEEIQDELGIDLMSSKELLTLAAPILISLFVLIALLAVWRMDAARASAWTILVLLATNFTSTAIRTTDRLVEGLLNEVRKTIDGLYQGVEVTAPIGVVVAFIGIIITVLSITGLGNQVALLLVQVGEINIVIFMLLLTVIIILLGMGMPTIAAYLLTVTIGVPALEEMGFNLVSAHLYILYVAILSNITPPIALSAAVASNIAGADFLQTSLDAIKIGIAGFILPFIILFQPALIQWQGLETVLVIAASTAGISFVVFSVFGQTVFRPLGIISRFGYAAAGTGVLLYLMVF